MPTAKKRTSGEPAPADRRKAQRGTGGKLEGGKRKNGKRAVILRYDSPKGYMNPEGDVTKEEELETETPVDCCIRSAFLGVRRMMIVCDGASPSARMIS